MADKKLELSKDLLKVVIVFLVGLFVFWGFKAYEILETVDGDYPREISVEATGKAYVVPDTAKIYLGVYSDGDTTEEVMEDNTDKINNVMSVLEKFDIEEEDIKTTSYNLYPDYQWTEVKGSYQDGYRLDQNVEVKLKDFDKVGGVLAAVIDAGANVIGDVSFVVDDPETAKTEARMDAIKKAKAKAEEIEEASGLKLGKVLSYYEYAPYDYGRDYAYAETMSYAAYDGYIPAPMIEPGQEEIQLTVTLSYRVK